MQQLLKELTTFFTTFLLPLNWELILAFTSFCLSVFTLLASFFKSREKYEVSIIDYSFRRESILQLFVVFTNLSSSPLTIKSVSCDGADCELEPKMIRGNPEQPNFVLSAKFPLCISSHSCQFAYLEFLDYQHTVPAPGINLTLKISSTRKLVSKTVLLGDISHYLHTKKELRDFQDSRQNT